MLSFGLKEEGGYKVLLSQREGRVSQRMGGVILSQRTGGVSQRMGGVILSQRTGGIAQRIGGMEDILYYYQRGREGFHRGLEGACGLGETGLQDG